MTIDADDNRARVSGKKRRKNVAYSESAQIAY